MLCLGLAVAATDAAAQPANCVPTRSDVERLSRLDSAWREARHEAIAGGSAEELRGLGVLAEPRVALNRPQPTPGRYLCRTIKLGAAHPDLLPYVAYGWFRCHVSLSPGGDLALRKTTGSQRPVGLICPVSGSDGQRIARFVGVQELGEETRMPRYGSDPDRDLVGVVQRIGDDRWRIAFPWPAAESKLDLLELKRTRQDVFTR
jgi:Domain of unknown function (DUF4893)